MSSLSFHWTMSKEIDMETQAIFNGDTPQGRAMWVPWLRSLELGMDEWSWAVLQGEVLPHGKVNELMKKDPVWPQVILTSQYTPLN